MAHRGARFLEGIPGRDCVVAPSRIAAKKIEQATIMAKPDEVAVLAFFQIE